MATQYYHNAKPERARYLSDAGRPTISWMCGEANRISYVSDGLTWTIQELKEHKTELLTALNKMDSWALLKWSNCLRNLDKAIELKEKEDAKYELYLEAHFYENYDLSP